MVIWLWEGAIAWWSQAEALTLICTLATGSVYCRVWDTETGECKEVLQEEEGMERLRAAEAGSTRTRTSTSQPSGVRVVEGGQVLELRASSWEGEGKEAGRVLGKVHIAPPSTVVSHVMVSTTTKRVAFFNRNEQFVVFDISRALS